MRVDQFEQFVVHGFRLLLLSASQRLGGAMMQVILHEVARHSTQGLLHGSHLRNDVRAVAVFFDHFLQATDLPLNAPEAVLISLFEKRGDPDSLATAPPAIASAIPRQFVPVFMPGPSRCSAELDWHNTLHPYLYPYPYIVSNQPCFLAASSASDVLIPA